MSAPSSSVDTRLRFVDGLVVEPSDCPRFIHARRHWRPGPDGRALCACHPDPVVVGPDDWTRGFTGGGAA